MGIIKSYGDVLNVVLRMPLWTGLYRGRIVGLIWYPRRGWCGWHFNHDGWKNRDATISPHGLPMPTPVPGIKMMFSYFMLYNYVCLFFTYIYTHICVHVFQRKHWWTLISFWPNELEKVGQPEENVLEKEM